MANRVKQAIEFRHSFNTFDFQREQKLFGKTGKDLELEKYGQPVQKGSRMSHVTPNKQLTSVSELKPQASIHAY